MTIKMLDTVVLAKDLPQRKLKRGDVGAVVQIYPPDGLEVEFVTGSGYTQALVTLKTDEVHPLGQRRFLPQGRSMRHNGPGIDWSPRNPF